MRSLAYNARLLKSAGYIVDTWFSNAAVRVKVNPTSKPIKITHEKDLVDKFPTFDNFTFDMDFYRRIQDDEDIDLYHNVGENIDDAVINEIVTPPSASEVEDIMAKIASVTGDGRGHKNSGENISGEGGSAGIKGINENGATGGETDQSVDVGVTYGAKRDVQPSGTPIGPNDRSLLDPRILQRGDKFSPPLDKSQLPNPHVTRSTTKKLANALFTSN